MRFPLGLFRRPTLATFVGMLIAITAACADNALGAIAPPSEPPPTGAPTTSPATPTAGNPISGFTLFVDPASKATRQADAWRASRPEDARQMEKIAAQSHAQWFGNWNPDVRADVGRAVAVANASGSVPVLVAYNVPQRDCGGYSAGGSNSPDGYRAWIDAFANGVGGGRAIVILEPDALAGMDCLSAADQNTRLSLVAYAVRSLRAKGGITVYIDAGHSRWQPASTMATRLEGAGIASADGFSLNVSNFHPTADQMAYGDALSALVKGKHYVIDTSRNGRGAAGDSQWCNPDGRALGERPGTATGNPLVDAFFWVKVPGESDGSCNGAPSAGEWMPEYALGLAQRASY